MRVYITGIDGMLGKALATLHHRAGDQVFGCDIWKRIGGPEVDIRDYESLRRSMAEAQPDRVYHTAAMLGVANTEKYPALCDQINIGGTQNALSAASEAGAADFVFLSSSEVYGDQSEALTENHELLGKNVYALGKMRGEQLVRGYWRRMNVVTCRMFNCFGVGQVRQFFIPKAIHLAKQGKPVPLYGSVTNKRSYLLSFDAGIHIKNVADNASNREIVNIAHPEVYSLLGVSDLVIKTVGSPSKVRLLRKENGYEDREVSRDIPNRIADTSKLRELSDHKSMGLTNAMKVAVAAYEESYDDWAYSRELR